MKLRNLYLMLTFALVLVLAACGNSDGGEDSDSSEESTAGAEESAEEGSEETVSFENTFEVSPGDGEDRGAEGEEVTETIEVPKNPEKVAIFDLGVVSTFQALGVEENIAGLPKGEGNGSLSDALSEFESDEYANLGGLKDPDFEEIARIQPDVIMIHGRQATENNLAEFERVAPDADVLFVAADNESYFDDIKEMTNLIGELYGEEEAADTLVEDMDNRIEEVSSKVAEIEDNSMLFIQTNGESSVSFHGTGGRFGYLYDTFGFSSADEFDDASDSHGSQVNYEFIANADPALMFVMDRGAVASGGEATPVDTLINSTTESATAVQNENIFSLDPQVWYLNAGGYETGMIQIDEVEEAVDSLSEQ